MDTLKIGGREFKAITNSTLEHDLWTFQQINQCGLQNATIGEDEQPDEFVRRVMLQVTSAGEIFKVLGGLLMPVDLDPVNWTVGMAEDTGRFMATVVSEEDKSIVRGQIAGAMASFLAQGLISTLYTRRFSAPEMSVTSESQPSPNEEPDSTASGPA